MRTCGIASCLIFTMIQLIYSREYARPSPTDMPFSQRDILNKKENMKTYIKTLKSFKVARPELLSNEKESFGHLLVEDEKIRIPPSARGLSEVTKMYLDQNKLNRYLRILDMELERTPATIELNSSKIIDYVKMLSTINNHERKSADLVSRSRIKLMKGGITDNIMYDEKGHQQETNLYNYDYLVDKRDTEGIENKNDKSVHASAYKNGLFFDSNIAGKITEQSFKENSGSQKSVDSDLDYSKSPSDILANQYVESENYDLYFDLGNQLLDPNIKQPANEKKTLSENTASNNFIGEEIYNETEPLDEELIPNLQIHIQPSSATEYSGLASERVDNNPQEPSGNSDELDLPNKVDVGEKSVLNNLSYDKDESKNQSLFDSPFDVSVPINHVNSKDFGDHEKRPNINGKREVEFQYPKREQLKMLGGLRYDNSNRYKMNSSVQGSGSGSVFVKDVNPGQLGSILNNLQNKLYNLEKPVNKLSQVADASDNVPNLNNVSLNHQFMRNMDLAKAIAIKSSAIFSNASLKNLSSTEPPLNSDFVSNGPVDHRIFPLKPEDEIVNVPKMKYFQQCFIDENNHYQYSQGMPTKPPKMFSKYYISRLKKFEKYDDDSGSLKFLKQPRLPLFGTKENEVSKILNVNLDHLHIDKGALFKIIGKALKIDEENTQDYAPPKWLEHKYEELLHSSHRGQNFNDYDYIEKSRHNMIQNDRFNIRDRKESVFKRKNTSL